MDSELNDLLLEIRNSFNKINSGIQSIKNVTDEDIKYLYYYFEYVEENCNDLNFYTRALRDKLEHE